MRGFSADELWRAIRLCWIDVYIGPQEVITHDAGKNFMAKSFSTNEDLLKVTTKCVPVESPNSMSTVERYHAPIRRDYRIIRMEAPRMDEESALKSAVKSINYSVGTDGLVLALLVYGAFPRIGVSNEKPTQSVYERAPAVRKATEEMTKLFSRRQVKDDLRSRNGPDTYQVRELPIGSLDLVYRTEKDKWEGKFSLLDLKGETCTILFPNGPTQFRSNIVKKYVNEDSFNENSGTNENLESVP